MLYSYISLVDKEKTILVSLITSNHTLHNYTCNIFLDYFLLCFLALGGVERTLICSRWYSSLWWRSSLSIFLVYFLFTGSTNSTTWSPSIRLFINMKMSFGTTNLENNLYSPTSNK